MFAVKGTDIKKIDRAASARYHIPSVVLMENAAIASCNAMTSKWSFSSCAVICGDGNNGGDGFALARHLFNRNCSVSAVFLGEKSRFSKETKTNFDILKKLNVSIMENPSAAKFRKILFDSEVAVDAVYGTGFRGVINKSMRKYFKALNESGKKILSLDIPSGVDATTGEFDNDSINSDLTVTFGFVKTGLLWNKTLKKTKELAVADISIPGEILSSVKHFFIIEREILSLLASEEKSSKREWVHKTQKGRASFIGGSEGMEGSIQMAAAAGLKSGSGIVYSYMLSKTKNKFFPEIVFTKTLEESLKKSDVWVVGCGLSDSRESALALDRINESRGNRVVVYDADALNLISKMGISRKKEFLKGAVITPHPEEFFRLSNERFSNIEEKIECAERFSKKYNTLLILKSPPTIVTDSHTTMVFPNMSAKLATAGSGDILAGILGGLLSQGYSPMASAAMAVYIHFYSGYNAKNDFPSASEFLSNISKAKSEVMNA